MNQGTRCEPTEHNYAHGWNKDKDADGVIFCRRCGDVINLAAEPEEVPLEDREDWPKMAGLFRREPTGDE